MMRLQQEIQEREETLDDEVSYIQTVHGNYEGYTKRETEPKPVIGHGILAGKYLAKYRDSLI
jgi:hypothetical protein